MSNQAGSGFCEVNKVSGMNMLKSLLLNFNDNNYTIMPKNC